MKYFLLATLTCLSVAYAADPFRRLQQTTVRVTGGTGSVVKAASGKAYVLTAYHVCLETGEPLITVSYLDGSAKKEPILAFHVKDDLCLVSATPQSSYALPVSDNLSKYGFTRGWPNGKLSEYEGRISRKQFDWSYAYDAVLFHFDCPEDSKVIYQDNVKRCQVDYRNVKTRIFAQPGSSGSPVVNKFGQLQGVIQSYGQESSDAGLVPLSAIQKFLNRF